jgi:hypothetical protein
MILIFLSIFIKKNNFKYFPSVISHNVSAVYDVFAVAIKERGAFQQPQKCGGEKLHKGRKPDCGFS